MRNCVRKAVGRSAKPAVGAGTYPYFYAGRTTDSTVAVSTAGGTAESRPVTFIGANGATYSVNGPSTTYDLVAQGLTAPFIVVLDDMIIGNTTITTLSYVNNGLSGVLPDISGNTAMQNFRARQNRLTGTIPSLAANTALLDYQCQTNRLVGPIPSLATNTLLTNFSCSGNALTGSIPTLENNTALQWFSSSRNQLTGELPDLSANTALVGFDSTTNMHHGNIPDLSANTNLEYFYAWDNQLTGWEGGSFGALLLDFEVYNNALSQSAIDGILAALVAAGGSNGFAYIGGTGNAAPSASGAADVATLISRGWTVSTN